MNKEPDGQVIVLVYNFAKNRYHEFRKPYYWTPKNRMNFRYSLGLFQGMKTGALGQFRLDAAAGYAEMITNPADYGKHAAKFAREVLKAVLKGRCAKSPQKVWTT
jgi:hypothetical protein